MSVAVGHNQQTETSIANWSPMSSSTYDVADPGQEATNAETGSDQSAPNSRLSRPKSAWKSRQRRPRFTDQLIVSETTDIDGEIETLILDEERSTTASVQQESLDAPIYDDDERKRGNKLAPHPPAAPRPQRRRSEHTSAAGKIDSDWPNHISPLTPRAWQDDDVITNTAMRTTPASDSHCSSGVDTPETVIELAVGTTRRHSRYSNGSASGNRSSEEFIETFGDDRTSDGLVAVAPSGLPPASTLQSSTSKSPSNSKGPQKSPSSVIGRSVKELEHIHQKVFDKYSRNTRNADAATASSPTAASQYSRHARYVPSQTSADVVASRLAASVVDNGDVVDSRIPLPVGKLAPIGQQTSQHTPLRSRNKVDHGEKRQQRMRKQRASMAEPSRQSLDNSGSAPLSETLTSGHRKRQLRPLIGRRGKAIFDTLETNGSGKEIGSIKYSEPTSSVERGSTFTLPPTSLMLSSLKSDDVIEPYSWTDADGRLLLSMPSTHLADPIKHGPVAESNVLVLNSNDDYFRFPVDQLNNTNIDLSWTASFEAPTSQRVYNYRPIIDDSSVNNERSKRLISTISSGSSFDENLPTGNSKNARRSRDGKETRSQFPKSVDRAGGIQSINNLRSNAVSTHAPLAANHNTFASLPLDQYSSLLLTDTVPDDVDLKEFSLFARPPVRATRSLPLDESSTPASASAAIAADHHASQAGKSDFEVPSINRTRIPVRVHSNGGAAPKTDSQLLPTADKFEPTGGLYDRLGESFDLKSTGLTTSEFEQISSSLPLSLPSAPSLDFGHSMSSSWNPQFSLTDMWKQLNVSSNKISPTEEMMYGYP